MMRFTTGLLLLLLYGLAVLKPVYPFLEYAANQDFIATVLCENRDMPELNCDGKCYLAKKLKAASNQNSEQEPVLINPFEYPISLVDDQQELVQAPQLLDVFLQQPNERLLELAGSSLFRPPRAQA